MKYLKKFEDNNTNTLKKYIIIQFFNTGNYFIIRIIPNDNENLITYDKYYYYERNIEISYNKGSYNKNDNIFEIKYQTDDEQDAIDALKIMIESSKYNL